MDPRVKASMLEYYDQQARVYDRVYEGKFAEAARLGAETYVADTAALRGIVAEVSRGRLLDVPCGTAFWLPSYAERVEGAVLIDQAQGMLAAARARAEAAGIAQSCTFLQGDVIDHEWEPEAFDTVLVGFFLSHVVDAEERRFFARIRRALRPGGAVMVFDSAWNAERAAVKPKEGVARRMLENRPFDVYKRYFDGQDLSRMAAEHGFVATVRHEGRAFIAATFA